MQQPADQQPVVVVAALGHRLHGGVGRRPLAARVHVQAAGENDGRRLPASHRLAHIVERGDHGSIETRLLERGVDADGVLEIVGGDQNSVSHFTCVGESFVVRRASCVVFLPDIKSTACSRN